MVRTPLGKSDVVADNPVLGVLWQRAAVAELADALDLGSSSLTEWRFKSSRPQ